MTILSTVGGGKLNYRVVIDGCPYQPVTQGSGMSASVSPSIGGRFRGLKMSDVRFTQKADPVQCKLEVGGLEIKLVDFDGIWSSVFDLQPTATTWLSADATSSATTINVEDTTDFPSSGYIWIDGECISYGNKTGTSFTLCTRGVLTGDSDAAQAHYITDGIRLRTPEVTNWPVIWEGRRVTIYRYEEGDSLTGSGTQCYRGVISTAPSFDGTTWTLGVDSIVSALEARFGGDVGEPCAPRGIKYPESSPMVIFWALTGVDPTYGTLIPPVYSGSIQVSGFWETQEDFCSDLQTQLNDSLLTYGDASTVQVISEGTVGWHLKYTTSATPLELRIKISHYDSVGGTGTVVVPALEASLGTGLPAVDGSGNLVPTPVNSGEVGFMQLATGVPWTFVNDGVPAASTDYYFFRPLAATPLGGVPRGVWLSAASASDDNKIYLDTPFPLSATLSAALMSGTDPNDIDYSVVLSVTATDNAAKSITAAPYQGTAVSWLPNCLPEIRLGLNVTGSTPPAGASVADLLDWINANSAVYQALGVVPPLRTNDYDSATWHDLFDDLPPINTQRLFSSFQGDSLMDIIRGELQAAGMYLALDTQGRLVPARNRLATAGEYAPTATVDTTTLLTDKARARREVNGYGLLSEVTYQLEYNPATGEFDGDTLTTRNAGAYARTPSVRSQDIRQLSQYIGGQPLTLADVQLAVTPTLGTFGSDYTVDTVDAAKAFGVELGKPVRFDQPYIIQGTSGAGSTPRGSLGATGLVGLVIGKEWGAYSSRVRLTVLTTRAPVGGYVPSAFITGAPVNISGNTWRVTLDTSYFPSGSDCTTWYPVGTLARVMKWNASTATTITGTVTIVTATTVTIALGSAWTVGSDTWYLNLQVASAQTSTSDAGRYAYSADSVRRLAFSDATVRARTFAP